MIDVVSEGTIRVKERARRSGVMYGGSAENSGLVGNFPIAMYSRFTDASC